MKLVLLFGPMAVGKMTVGQELAKMTELKLFHNHMTIELLCPYFGFSPEMWELAHQFRMSIFETYAKGEGYGMIFTFVWAFDVQADWDYVKQVGDIFEKHGGEVYWVELEAELDTRIERNRGENRLANKPSKRDVEQSEARMLTAVQQHRLNSNDGELVHERYLKINNTFLTPEEVAGQIKAHFQL
ncbi:AAA domain-containing protein [Paenibacillus taihuensis]|uniref:AAA domain-containing protein n=1 Tax=Paenibacillus taihuensis TaxID=1156355 RepID=A0A3D9QUP0_9BACL|nr:AAA family ATPase [Paenibacillus taihuensis]REE67960.1 AAA domain-containing protein [Paenibacillus taihuensis]